MDERTSKHEMSERKAQGKYTYQDKVHKLLQALLADVIQKARSTNLLPVFERQQPVLGEAVVEHVRAVAELLHLLHEVRTTDHANGHVLSQLREVFDHLR